MEINYLRVSAVRLREAELFASRPLFTRSHIQLSQQKFMAYSVNIDGLTPQENAQISADLRAGRTVTLAPAEDQEEAQSAEVELVLEEEDECDDLEGLDGSGDESDDPFSFTPKSRVAPENPYSFW